MEKLSLKVKVSFAMGGIAINLANLTISQWLLKRYLPDKQSAIVSSAVFLAAFFIGRLIDGIMDPLIGNWSDSIRHRSGRRTPFIRAAILPVAVVSALIWIPPFPDSISPVNSVFIFIMIQLFFIFWTTLANPFMSLLPELTGDRNERIGLSTMLAVCYMIGTIIFAFTGSIIEAVGYRGLGIVLSGIIIISFLPTLIFIKEKNYKEISPDAAAGLSGSGILNNLKEALTNRPFLILLVSTSLFWFALNSVTVIIPFWVEAAAGGSAGDVTLVMAPFILANILFFIFFNRFSKAKGKYPAFILTLAGSAAVLFLFTLQRPDSRIVPIMLQTQICMGLFGVFVAGFLMLPNAMLADVIDYDEERFGKRREGLFFGLLSIFQKITIGLSISVSSVLMYLGGGDTASVPGLKIIAAAGGAAALAALLIFICYPLRAERSA